MKFVFILLFCLCVTRLFCQNDSSKLDFSAYSYNGIAVLKKADIIRLAGNDFMQLIQAAFPFISSSTIEEDYSFLVNGFILTNPNSINVSQIENVRFYPAGTILSPGNMTKNGTFVIETRPEETGFSLSTKTGAVVPRKDEMPSISKSGKGFLTSSELTYQQQKQNFFISNSVSWLHNKFPDYADVSAYSISKNKGNWNRLRISNFAGYQISRSWTIEGGAFFTSQPQNTKGNIEYLPPLFLKNTSTSSEKKTKYAGANGALIFSPVISVKNILSAETVFSKQQTEAQSYTTYNTGQFVSSIRTYNGKFKEYSFTEHFMWNPVNSTKVKLQVSALIRYYLQRTDENSHLSLIEAGSVNNDSIYQKIRSKNLLVSPSVGIRIKEIISAQIGLTYDDYSNYRYGDNKKKKVLPNASLKIDMSSYLNNSKVKSLVIYSSYYQNLNNYENMDKLDRDLYSYTPPGMVGKIGLGAYTPSSNWFNSISLSALQNRVAFEIAHTIRNKVIRFYSPWYSSGGNTVYEMVFQDVKMQSLAFVVRTSIIAKERKSWNLSGTLSSTNNKARNNFMAYAADRIYLNNQNTLWNGGFTTSVQLNQFFAQMSAVLSFNKSGLDNYGMAIPDLDRYNMNFFLMGYKLRMKSTSIKSAEVNIQCTNLLHSKENLFDRYLGLGVNLIF